MMRAPPRHRRKRRAIFPEAQEPVVGACAWRCGRNDGDAVSVVSGQMLRNHRAASIGGALLLEGRMVKGNEYVSSSVRGLLV